jgi:hypothetical protein
VASVAASRIDSWQSSWQLICRPPMAGEIALILRRTGIAALVVSISLGMTSNVLFLAAFQFRFDRFFEPTRIVASGATPAELLRWAAVLDLFGYYLATAVRAYVLWRQLRQRNRLIADLSTTAAVGYGLAGGVGAAVLAMVAPMLMHNYTDATAAGQALIAAQFATVLQVVWRAIWQFLDAILLAAWWLGIGWLLRAARPRLPAYRWLLAASAIAGAAANVAGLSLVRDVLLGALFVLWTAWWISLFVIYARQQQTTSTIFPS